jgi:hypothetical protein
MTGTSGFIVFISLASCAPGRFLKQMVRDCNADRKFPKSFHGFPGCFNADDFVALPLKDLFSECKVCRVILETKDKRLAYCNGEKDFGDQSWCGFLIPQTFPGLSKTSPRILTFSNGPSEMQLTTRAVITLSVGRPSNRTAVPTSSE